MSVEAKPPSADVRVQRVYEATQAEEGGPARYRVLVDRLWPRGVAKGALAMDEWCKDVAPSTDLRRWYGHRPERFDEFAERYRAELAEEPAAGAVRRLASMASERGLVLLTATKEVDLSAAEVLRRHLTELAG